MEESLGRCSEDGRENKNINGEKWEMGIDFKNNKKKIKVISKNFSYLRRMTEDEGVEGELRDG